MRRVFRIPFTLPRVERDVDDELDFHLEMRAQRLVAQGMTPDAARDQALRQFGDVDPVRDDCISMDEQRERASVETTCIDELQQDVVYALRTLQRNLGFTAVIVGALALGIGANTAIFTLIDAVLVRTLPVPHPEQLVAIGDPRAPTRMSTARRVPTSSPIRSTTTSATTLGSSATCSPPAARLGSTSQHRRTSAEFEHPRGRFVSGNYFSVLGVQAAARPRLRRHRGCVAGAFAGRDDQPRLLDAALPATIRRSSARRSSSTTLA